MKCIELLKSAVADQVLPTDGRVMVACSGGQDSTALLYALSEMPFNWQLVAATVNHGLHDRASDACSAVVAHAEALGIPCHVLEVSPTEVNRGAGTEDGARQARYRVLENLCMDLAISTIVTAHHAMDQAETVFMRMLKGTGLKGAGGIPERRGFWSRPWLGLCPSHIAEFVLARGLSFVADPTNVDNRFERNRFRHVVKPAFDAFIGPDWAPRTARSVRRLQSERQAMMALLEHYCESIFAVGDETVRARWPSGAVSNLQKAAIIRLAFERARREFGKACPPWFEQHIDSAIALSQAGSHERGIDVGGGWRAIIGPEGFRLESQRRFHRPSCAVTVHGPGLYRFGPWDVSITAQARSKALHWVSEHSLTFPCILRVAERGERFQPKGAPGHKRIRRLWGDRKVPRSEREFLPVLEGSTGIIWVAKLRVAEAFGQGEYDAGFEIELIPRSV